MCFFENDYFLNILKTYKDKTFPMLVPVIVDLAEHHWHKILQESLIALKTILKEIDPMAFADALNMSAEERKKYAVKQTEVDRRDLDTRWEGVNQTLAANGAYKPPSLPFVQDTLIRDYNPLYYKIYDKVKAVEL